MSKSAMAAICLLPLLLVTACAKPKIESASIGRPKTVVILDFPDPRPAATISVVTPNWPESYFSGRFDRFYLVEKAAQAQNLGLNATVTGAVVGASTGGSVAKSTHGNVGQSTFRGAAVGGVVGGIIGLGADATEREAEAFPSLFSKAMPQVDMHKDLLNGIKAALEAKGIRVTIAGNTRETPPRLYWPAKPPRGENLSTGSLDEHPAVDADILVQLAPLAIYAAPGPLNNYNSKVGIAVAIYHGRRREFIGWQAIVSKENELWYASYDSLVADIQKAAPAQYRALLSLVPQVVNLVSGEQH